MAEGRGKFEWGQTSCMMALIANIMRDPKKSKALTPADFNPYNEKKKQDVVVPVSFLKELWCREEKTTSR